MIPITVNQTIFWNKYIFKEFWEIGESSFSWVNANHIYRRKEDIRILHKEDAIINVSHKLVNFKAHRLHLFVTF